MGGRTVWPLGAARTSSWVPLGGAPCDGKMAKGCLAARAFVGTVVYIHAEAIVALATWATRKQKKRCAHRRCSVDTMRICEQAGAPESCAGQRRRVRNV